MAEKVTMKIPKWQHNVLKKIKESDYPDATIPELMNSILSMFTALRLAMDHDFKYTLYPGEEELDDKELAQALQQYWAGLGQDKQEETMIEVWDKVKSDKE